MLDYNTIKHLLVEGRSLGTAKTGMKELGPYAQLPGVWANKPNLPGRGWNMIALPFIDPAGSGIDYRLLMNQYNEELRFNLIDKAVPNRGIDKSVPENTDQLVATLDYEQTIKQIKADDFPKSGLAGGEIDIHHEPGLFLHMANLETDGLDLARLATIPHGNSVLALGRSTEIKGAPKIPDESGLPIGSTTDLDNPYLAPYKHFHDNPFEGVFDPVHPNALLERANQGVDIVKTTEIEFDTKFLSGGVLNIPFVEKQADASEMTARFWIQELAEKNKDGSPKLRLQYTQTVMLDFFKRRDGEGLIKWPHISINTLEKVSNEPDPEKKQSYL